MNAKKKILFLCTHNAARSQMAEGFVNALYGDRYKAHSAGNEPTELHPCAITVMAEVGIDIASQRAKSLDELDDMSFDYVVTLCADNQESCPIFSGGETYLQQAFPDPVPARAEEHTCGRFRRVRDQIKAWLKETFSDDE
ncbi:MAG: arsenate reductase ArsC [Halobacteriota archaeon]